MSEPEPLKDYQIPSQYRRRGGNPLLAAPETLWVNTALTGTLGGSTASLVLPSAHLAGNLMVFLSGMKLSKNLVPPEFSVGSETEITLLVPTSTQDTIRVMYLKKESTPYSKWETDILLTVAQDQVTITLPDAPAYELGPIPYMHVWVQGLKAEYQFIPPRTIIMADPVAQEDIVEATFLTEV